MNGRILTPMSLRSMAGGGGIERLAASESMANFDISRLHVNYALSNLSIAYTNAQFLAETIAPIVPSDKPSNDYYVYGFERFLRKDTNRAPGAAPAETGWDVSPTAFKTSGHSIRGWYPWEGPAAADPALDLDVDTTEVATDQVLIDQECNLVDMLKANCTILDLKAAANGGGQYQFDNPGCDPIAFLDVQKETVAKAIGRRPNSILYGRPAFRGYRSNANVLRHIYGTTMVAQSQMITPAMVKEQLELDNVFVAEPMWNTAGEGQAPTLDYIWGNLCVLFYLDPGSGRRKLNLATTFLWDIALPSAPGDTASKLNGWIVEKWYDKDRKRMNIDVTKYYAQVLVAAGAGVLFENSTGYDAGGELGA